MHDARAKSPPTGRLPFRLLCQYHMFSFGGLPNVSQATADAYDMRDSTAARALATARFQRVIASLRLRRVRNGVRVALAGLLVLALTSISGVAAARPNPDSSNPWNIAFQIDWSYTVGLPSATFLEADGVSMNNCGGPLSGGGRSACNFLNKYTIGGVETVGDNTPVAGGSANTDHLDLFDEQGPDGASFAAGSFGQVFQAPSTGTLSSFSLNLACEVPNAGQVPTLSAVLFELNSDQSQIVSQLASVPFDFSTCPTTTSFNPSPTTFAWMPFAFNTAVTAGSNYAVLLTGPAIGGNQPSVAPSSITGFTSAATAGTAYSDAVSAQGSPAPTYAVTGGALPAGLSLNAATGAITGTPTAAGSYSVTITATNSAGSTSHTFTGAVAAGAPAAPTTITGLTSTPAVGAAFSDSVSGNGSPAPTYAVTGGALPAGLTLNPASGAITGTPTTAGPYSVTITATNTAGSQTHTFTGNVTGGPTTVTGLTTTPTVGAAFSDSVTADGYPAPTYAVTGGALPAGLSLNTTTGAVTGTPTTAGAYSVTITATNASGSSSHTFTGTVLAAPGTVTGFTATPVVGSAFNDTVTATGTPAPTYAVTGGALPAGLTLNTTTGAVTGTPTTAGAYSVTITATNSAGSASHTFTGTVAAAPVAPTTVTGFTATPVVGSAFNDTVTATGTPAPTYAVTGGALPAGLSLNTTTGAVTGTPTTAGAYSVTITATNSAGSASQTFTGTVAAAPVAPTTVSGMTSSPVVGTAYSDTAVGNGAPAPTYAVTGGALPAGLTLNTATGAVTGTPTTAGAYSVTITATNSAGSASHTFTGTVAATVANAPTSLTATPTDGGTTLTFQVPTIAGGTTITGYQISTDGGTTWQPLTTTTTGSTVTATVTGLTNGTTYPVSVRAVNSAGTGAPSATVSVTPVPPPPAPPTAPTAVAGASSVTVSWTASNSAGVTGYTVVAQPGPATCTTDASTTRCVIGAVAGTAYTYTVIAHSPSGDSVASSTSTAATPSLPTLPSEAPSSAEVTLTTTDGTLAQVTAGQPLTVVGTGFAPYSSVVIAIYSTPIVLAVVTTDSSGAFTAPVVVPSDLASGSHTFLASGVDPAGNAHFLSMPVTLDTAPLASTGSNIADPLIVAAALLLLGSGLALCGTIRGRRKLYQ